MSDVVGYKGFLKPVDLKGMAVEDYAKKLTEDESPLECYDTYLDYLTSEKDYIYNYNTEILYKIEKHQFDYQEHVEIKEESDGNLSFTTVFYNGGTYLSEMLQDGFDKL